MQNLSTYLYFPADTLPFPWYTMEHVSKLILRHKSSCTQSLRSAVELRLDLALVLTRPFRRIIAAMVLTIWAGRGVDVADFGWRWH
jgi:hypothetical protein